MQKSESEVAQSCLTLHDPMDCSLPGSSVHGIFQARVLEWGAIAFSEGRAQVSINAAMYAIDLPPDSFSIITQQVLITSYVPGIILGVDGGSSTYENCVQNFEPLSSSLILQLVPNFKNKHTKKTSRNIQSCLKWVYS